MINRFKCEESGYSLVEVLAAIVILAVAIIPMVGMFDAGLRAASTGGNFDKARAQANQELESIRALPYYNKDATNNSAREFYPPANGDSPPAGNTTPCRTTPLPAGIASCDVRTDFVKVGPSSVETDGSARSMMRVQVTVRWSGGEYTATGLSSQETA